MSKVPGRKKRIIGTTIALVAIGGGAAFAYWTATGTGNTTAKAGSSTAFSVTASITSGADLSPGGPVQTATFEVTNTGSGVQKLRDVHVSIANADGSPWTPVSGCSAEDFTVGVPDFTPTELAKDGGKTTGTVSLQMKNRVDVNQDGCKGETVPLYFAAS
jgi:hypothetical protein